MIFSRQFALFAARLFVGGLLALLAACAPSVPPSLPPAGTSVSSTAPPLVTPTPDVISAGPTALPTRTFIESGALLPYAAQSGDTLTTVALHFNTTPEKILEANPNVPTTGTLPPGLALNIPAYYFPFGGPTFKIVPDDAVVYGPSAANLDVAAFIATQTGGVRELSSFSAGKQRDAAQTVLYVARQFSINPRILLALMEWRTGALTNADAQENPLGNIEEAEGFAAQLRWASEQLSIGYYGWRHGTFTSLDFEGGYTSRVDSYQNAGTVAVQYLLSQLLTYEDFEVAAGPEGFAATYRALWGDPFAESVAIIPGNLTQPILDLPFERKQSWAFTGGPHPGWGQKLPWAALDFAPPAGETGCITTDKWVTASAPGVIVRSEDNTIILDLDGDGVEQTGWIIFYFHMSNDGMIPAGSVVQAGDFIGHPSCEGGISTGTHVHMARRYNGEWLLADGVIPFVLGGWLPVQGDAPYKGRMTRLGAWVEACTCSMAANRVYWGGE